MKVEKMNLDEGIKLVSFATKGGVYVYQNKKLVGIMTTIKILNTMDV